MPWNGRVLPLDYLARARALCDRHGIGLHLDGARLYNAAVASDVPARTITAHFDSVSVCLSKGLGAPVGSVLLGSAGFIDSARRWRKVTGGGMRQSGILAAAGLHALDHHVADLAQDHARAVVLADALQGLPGLSVGGRFTNMVFVQVSPDRIAALAAHMEAAGVRLAIGPTGLIRLVLHRDVDDGNLGIGHGDEGGGDVLGLGEQF